MTASLPIELLEHIIWFIADPAQLCKLSSANSVLHSLANQSLYRNLQPRSLPAFVLLYRTLLHNQSLAACARALDLRSCGWPLNAFNMCILTIEVRKPAVTRLLHRVIHALPALRRLIFPIRRYMWDPDMLPSSLPKTVEVLELGMRHEMLAASAKVVGKLPQLRELVFDGWLANYTTDWQALLALRSIRFPELPNLKSLTAPTVIVNALIGRRPVTTLRITSPVNPEHLALSAPHWSTSTGPLKHLVIEVEGLKKDGIETVCRRLSFLEYLELISNKVDGGELVDALTTTESLESLESLIHLSRLSIRGGVFRDLQSKDYTSSAIVLGDACTALAEIILEGRTGKYLTVFGKVRIVKEEDTGDQERRLVWKKEERFRKRMSG